MAAHTRAYSETDGLIGYASSINRTIDDVISTVNALNSANIITSGVDTVNLNAGAVTANKLDYESKFLIEVFS